MQQGPRIYNLFPLLAGTARDWTTELPRIARMGFNWVFLNPVQYPGFSGSLYAIKDYRRLNPLFDSGGSMESQLSEFIRQAERHGLAVMLDLVINHTAKDSPLIAEHPDWYLRDEDGEMRSPFAVDPDDPDNITVWGDLAELDYSDRPARREMVAYWTALVGEYTRLGFHGFRCDAAYKVPGEVWAAVIEAARAEYPETHFFAETLGAQLAEVQQLHSAGFDYFFNSAKWWDFRAPWLLEQYEMFRHVAPSVAFPESHDTPRLAEETGGDARLSRFRYLFSAFVSTGVMIPIGYEYGFRRPLHVVETRPEHREEPAFDISDYIGAVNAMKARLAALNEEGPQELVTPPGAPVVALLRRSDSLPERVLGVINADGEAARVFPVADIEAALDAAPERITDATPQVAPAALRAGERLTLQPWEMRVFVATPQPVPGPGLRGEGRPITATRMIVIENVSPQLDGGRYPVKREVGDFLEVSADIFKEGHDVLAAVVRYREQGVDEWNEVPMKHRDNDRWYGGFPLAINSRYQYTIFAWLDHFESWRHELEKKVAAGQEVGLELLEGRSLVEEAAGRVDDSDERAWLDQALRRFDAADDPEDRAELLLSNTVRRIAHRHPDRSVGNGYEQVLEVVVDRPQARFSAWYEMFPRSQGTEPGKSATFKDCERRLREIRDMGFDVVYLVPVHPIGRIHRKGPDNTPDAGPDDPGSPYAIGAEEGGHTAVHPELGTLEDFRRFVRRCHEFGMEVAMDFAIQCSPDHPYLEEHPEWFRYRPDGSIKHAENPPKRYEDIVNVNFYGLHQDELWREWRDVLLFWIEQGVKIFRVDNPHTKPLQFWEWCIREIQDRHPEVIFLSEAFTRPKLLKSLAKGGFTQSYTYFTWRNFKPELTEYLTELTETEVKEYLRPNFFTNTPDILPVFLQTGGRPAFRIRLVLAATLSSVYGIYNGFELCENEAVPGTEEYLHSEKYQYKVWDWDRPGHIKDEIARINRIRRDNPALHELENLRFYPAEGDSVLFYGKMTLDRSNAVFIAVNLDPFEAHAATLTFPLAELGIPDRVTYQVEELLTGRRHLWRGAEHRVRLDPEDNPAQIFRITPWAYHDYVEPCM